MKFCEYDTCTVKKCIEAIQKARGFVTGSLLDISKVGAYPSVTL